MEIAPQALEHRNEVIAKIIAQYEDDARGAVLPVVSLEDFFEFNWDENSLAPNKANEGRPRIQDCYKILLNIRNRADVQDVLVAIHETPDADEPFDNEIWPDSDTVYILTNASRDDVGTWAAPLKPDDIGDTWSCDSGQKPNAAPDLSPGMRVFAVWWD